MGRRRTAQLDGEHLAIQTDVRGARRSVSSVDDKDTVTHSRTASTHSLATSTDEQVNTTLSASSAGTLSSEVSANSTARTSTMSNGEDITHKMPQLHPKITVLDLVSTSGSSSALPEGFGFSVSRKGTFIAVFSSANIWLINAAMLPRLFTRSLEIRRKPIALDILDDGSTLAVLSKPTQVDLYKLNGENEGKVEKHRTVLLENEATTLALTPCGLILATNHRFGIEIFSICPDASESCRRTAACPPMDCLEFSDDGRTLLCTTYARKSGGSTVFSVNGSYDGPFTEEGEPIQQEVDKAWTTQILFPEKINFASQATLLPDRSTGQINEIFAYNTKERHWGVYDVISQEFTNTKIALPPGRQFSRVDSFGDTIPAVSLDREHVALGLGTRNTSLWLYGLTDDAEVSKGQATHPCFSLPILHGDHPMLQEIEFLRWVEMSDSPGVKRLLAVGNITEVPVSTELPGLPQAGSTGVVVVMDFDGDTQQDSIPSKMTYDLDNILPGERLPEEDIEFEREVELVRTRTVAQRRAADRAADGRRASRLGSRPATSGRADRRSTVVPDEELERDEVQALFEAPYDHSQPRSQMSLSRAATVAATAPANRRHLRALPFRPLEYRRADGLREIPHESDADNWVPPPPPYTPNVDPTNSQPYPESVPTAPPVPSTSSAAPSTTATAPPRSVLAPNQRSVSRPSPPEIPAVPPLPTTSGASNGAQLHPSPYSAGSTVATQSATDLSLSLPRSHPSLVHPSTFPSPAASSRRRSSTASPRGSVSQPHNGPQPNLRLPSVEQQSAYQATAARNIARADARSRQSPRPPIDRANTGTPTRQVAHDLRPLPPLPFANPFPNNVRRGSAPDISVHSHRRPVAGSQDQAHSPFFRPESRPGALRHSMLPRLTTGNETNGPHYPVSAPPFPTTRQQLQNGSNGHFRNEDRDKKFPGKKRLACIVM